MCLKGGNRQYVKLFRLKYLNGSKHILGLRLFSILQNILIYELSQHFRKGIQVLLPIKDTIELNNNESATLRLIKIYVLIS